MTTIRNPLEWTTDVLGHAVLHVGAMSRSLRGSPAERAAGRPEVRRIAIADLKDVLRQGFDDFAACRTDVMFLCLIYPVIGVVLIRAAFNYGMLPLIFPLAAGLALLGPLVGVLLYEMSRRREQGGRVNWADAFGVLASPSLGAIVVMALFLLGIFVLWLGVANNLYILIFGYQAPTSASAFVSEVLTTPAGWTMTIAGTGIGFLFALAVLLIGVVTFPLLLDRQVGLGTAIATSFRAVVANPVPMAAWGLIVAASLAIGTLPVFLGLIFVLPVLGHATWHLYRKVVTPRHPPLG